MAPVAKRKLSISLDEDLVRSLEEFDESVSMQINAAVREDLARRVRRRQLVEMLDQLDEKYGPTDEDGIRGFEELQLAPLPCWRDLSPEERLDKVVAMIKRIEATAKAEREKTVASRWVPTRSASRARSPPPRRRARSRRLSVPRVRRNLRRAGPRHREFKAKFRQAAEMLRAGDKNAPFPVGSFPPRLPFVRDKPPPLRQASLIRPLRPVATNRPFTHR